MPPPTTAIASPPPRYAPRARNRTQTPSRRRSLLAPPPASSGSPRTGHLRGRPSPTATPEASTSSRGARARLVPLPRALFHLQRRRTEQPTRHQRRRARTCAPNARTSTRVGVPRSFLPHAPPRGSPGKPCTAEHHRQDATAEKAGEGPGCNLFFSFKGVSARFTVYTSELLKCETNHRKIRKMQTQLIWNPCNKIYKFCNIHICRNSTEFNLGKRLRKPPYACS